jgi:hypothetical protein
MTSDQNNNSGCLFPFGDDFLPIFMFFFHLNQADNPKPLFDEDDEEEDDDGE